MTYTEQLQDIVDKYQRAGMRMPASMREIAFWAYENKLWEPRQYDIISQLAEELARAAREKERTDKRGYRYRAMHCARTKAADGGQLVLWADMDDPSTTRGFMEISLTQRRNGIVGDCAKLKRDKDHFNASHPLEEPIQLTLNFEDDVREIEAVEAMELEEAETSSTEPRPQVAQFVNADHPSTS